MRTFFDDDEAGDDKEARAKRLQDFPKTFVPFAEALSDDFEVVWDFVDAINKGVQVLGSEDLSAVDKAAWVKASEYMSARPF